MNPTPTRAHLTSDASSEDAPAPAAVQPPANVQPPFNSPLDTAPHTDEPRGALAAWARLVDRRRWVVLIAVSLVMTLAGLWGPAGIGHLTSGGFEDPASPSAVAADRITAQLGRQDVDLVVVYRSSSLSVDDPAMAAAVAASLAKVSPGTITWTQSYWSTHSPTLASTDGHAGVALLRLKGADIAERMQTYRDTEALLRVAGSGLTVQLGGLVAINAQINTQVQADLAKAEAISMPVLLILMFLVFASAFAAGLPLAVGGFSILGSFAVIRLIDQFTEVSIFAVNIVTIMGLGLAIDYSLFVVSRFREELASTWGEGEQTDADSAAAGTRRRHTKRPAASKEQIRAALTRTMATAGRTVIFSGVTVAISLLSLTFFPQPFLRSMGYGGVSAVLIAVIGALTALPALLSVFGARVGGRRRRLGAGGGWARFAHLVMRRPIVFTAASIAILALLGSPFLHVRFGGIDARALPTAAEARQVDGELRSQFPALNDAPIQVLVEGVSGPTDPRLAQLSSEITGLQGVDAVAIAAAGPQGSTPATGTRPSGPVLLAVTAKGQAVDDSARAVVTSLRALQAPQGVSLSITGVSARQVDLRDSIAQRLPLMAGFAIGATFVLLFLAFGSFVLPLKAVAMNVLSLGASFGVVTWIFQDGHLADQLGFTSTGTVETTQPILMLAILFGLSMDYEVFLLSRIREEWLARRDNTAAVAIGLQRTGGIITSAALLLVVVIVAFSASGITFIKLLGVGMAVAVIVDATIVRAVLVPATMRLLGRWNWWAPAPLARWQEGRSFH